MRIFANEFGISQSFEGIGKGPDGNPWFVGGPGVGKFDPATDGFTDYFLPSNLGSGGCRVQ